MNKLLIALLFLSIITIQAGQPLVLSPRHAENNGPYSIDGLVYSQTYSFENLDTGISNYSGGNRWVCDDFELDDNYYLTGIRVWMIFTGSHASQMNLVISEDDLLDWDPNTNIHIWEESVPCTNLLTCDWNWGYDIYETYCTINSDVYPELDAGTHYYFETQADTHDNSFILVDVYMIDDGCWGDWGNGEWYKIIFMSGYPHMFFDFYGEPVNALESETWGSIKTLF